MLHSTVAKRIPLTIRQKRKMLKSEQIYGNKLITKGQMKAELFEYIEIWYNRERRHSTLGNLTIEQFNNKEQKIKKAA